MGRIRVTGQLHPPESMEEQTIQQLPQIVEQLGRHLQKIRELGWQQDCVITLKNDFKQLKQVAKNAPHPAITVLIEKLNEKMQPLLQQSHAAPSERSILAVEKSLDRLQEAMKVNLTAVEATSWRSTSPPKQSLIIGLTDKQLAQEIAQQVNYFGYHCIFCDSLKHILEITQENAENFAAIILDPEYCLPRDPKPLKRISEKIPIIFISTQQDVATRLFSVEAGGEAYFICPLEFTSLIEKIDQLVMPESESPPFRILIVEDSRTQANSIKKILEKSVVIVEILTDPLKINEVLTEFQPDLILLDLYMPQCSGVDLAKVIRQQDPFVSIPIVYLSAEDDMNKQLHAMKGGGDDFLNKNISPDHLIDTVLTRAQRSRTLRSEMIQDGLTGLLNHTRILEQLELEIARAKRNKTTLSFVMIDLDYFKMVNDSHGHPVGDRVIKGLARLLKQRLRKVDSIGRYGGEEFAIILPQSEGKKVYKILDEIRRGFSKLLHRSHDPLIEFTATFSAGLAELNDKIDTVDKLVQAADKALYTAKEQGRNCIVYNDKLN